MKTAERRWVLKLPLGGFCFDFLSTLSFRSSERKGAGVGVWGCSQYSFSKSGFTFSNRGIKQNYDAKTILPSELSDNLSVLNNTGKTPLLSPLESLFPFWIPYTYIPGTKCSIYRGKGRRTSRNGSVFDYHVILLKIIGVTRWSEIYLFITFYGCGMIGPNGSI